MDKLTHTQYTTEVFSHKEAMDRQIRNNNKHIKNKQEYNLNYGQEVIKLIIPVVESCMKRIYDNEPSNSPFYHNYVKKQRNQHIADKLLKVKTWDRAWDPLIVLPELVATTTTSNLSKELTLNNIIASVANSAVHQFCIPFNDREKWRDEAVKFFTPILFEVAQHCEVFEITQEENRSYRLRLHPVWKKRIEKYQSQFNFNVSNYKPMVIKPTPHMDLVSAIGGYMRTESPLLKCPAIINGEIPQEILDFNAVNNPAWFRDINKAQETPYCVNEKLLEVIEDYYNSGMTFAKFPNEIDVDKVNHDAEKEIEKRNEVRAKFGNKPLLPSTVKNVKNSHMNNQVELVRKTEDLLDMARTYVKYEYIYFPIFVDYRGRRYPYANTGLSYQGDEMAKSLLQFGDKRALDEKGLEAMFESLANSIAGIGDKIHRNLKAQKARDWFNENRSTFEASDYSMFFLDSHLDEDDRVFDYPIIALSIVLELMEYIKDPEYKTGFICHRDARCSGASIIGTLMRDEGVMRMTSVIDTFDSEMRLGDVYTKAAIEARRLCEEMAEAGCEVCKTLLEMGHKLFTRGSFKNVVMTKASYGATTYGMRKKNREMHDWEGWGFTMEHKNKFDNIMEEAVDNALPSCSAYMAMAKDAAFTQIENLGHIRFTNPVNEFPVFHHEFKVIKRKINTTVGGKRVRITLMCRTDKTDKMGMRNAFSPNLIHALDSALLSLVESQVDYDMALIHDSIGSHPNDTHRTVEAYSNAINLYATNNLFQLVFDEMDSGIKVELTGDAVPFSISEHCLC